VFDYGQASNSSITSIMSNSYIPSQKNIKEYEVHATGVDRKTSVKTIIKARDPEEAGKIAMIFCKVAGVTFSHTKVKV